MAVSGRMRVDLLGRVGGRPATGETPIDEPRDVRRLRLRLDGADLSAPRSGGRRRSASTATSSSCAIRRRSRPGPPTRTPRATWRRSRSSRATRRRSSPKPTPRCAASPARRARAERLTRYVNALLDKKPTVSLPSAREVLRTKVGDCNEHTALYVAMARALGIPARIAVGLVYIHGAFYYHAWPEVYLDEGIGPRPVAAGRSDVQPVSRRRDAPAPRARRPRQAGGDPAADRTAEDRPCSTSSWRPNSTPILVGPAAGRSRRAGDPDPAARVVAAARAGSAMIAIHDLVKRYGTFTAVDGVSLDVHAGRDPRLSRPERRRQDDDAPDDRRAAEADLRPHPRQRPRSRDASPRRRRRRSASFPIARSSTRS